MLSFCSCDPKKTTTNGDQEDTPPTEVTPPEESETIGGGTLFNLDTIEFQEVDLVEDGEELTPVTPIEGTPSTPISDSIPPTKWRVSLTTKTFIPPNVSIGFAGAQGANQRALDFVNALKLALNGNDIVKNHNPDDQEYRLFSRGNLEFTCNGDNISDVNHYDIYWGKKGGVEPPSANVKVGDEGKMSIAGVGLFTFGPETGLIFEKDFKRKDKSTWQFRWKYMGRPSPTAEPLFYYVTRNTRTSVYIWHDVIGECFCKNGVGYWRAKIDGSAFPSHSTWFFENIAGSMRAQDIDNLWQPYPGAFDQVVFRTQVPKSIAIKGKAKKQ